MLYLCIMNQKSNIGQAFLGVLFSLLYCLALQKAITQFFNMLIFSILQNYRVTKFIAFPLLIHC